MKPFFCKSMCEALYRRRQPCLLLNMYLQHQTPCYSSPQTLCVASGGMGRNLIPAEVPHLEEAHTDLPEPLKVSFGAIALPHPEKIADGGPKAVNKKWEGWGGEDAYFCTDERSVLPLQQLLTQSLECLPEQVWSDIAVDA